MNTEELLREYAKDLEAEASQLMCKAEAIKAQLTGLEYVRLFKTLKTVVGLETKFTTNLVFLLVTDNDLLSNDERTKAQELRQEFAGYEDLKKSLSVVHAHAPKTISKALSVINGMVVERIQFKYHKTKAKAAIRMWFEEVK